MNIQYHVAAIPGTGASELPISPAAWSGLVEANEKAASAGWAARGVFATGIGPEYQRGAVGSLLYVGKSAGPWGRQSVHATTSSTASQLRHSG